MKAIWGRMHCTGMSEETATSYGYEERGVEASHRAAREDWDSVSEHRVKFVRAARDAGIDKEILAAIASRESRVGKTLSETGYGKEDHYYGMMHVDETLHTPDKEGGPTSYFNVKDGAEILRHFIKTVENRRPKWTTAEQLKIGIAAYNRDPDQAIENGEACTEGGDYANDVLARAQYFRQNWKK